MSEQDDPATRLRVALDLAEAGIELKRQNLRRRHPSETEEQIDARLAAWLEEPDAGDASGILRPIDWRPRT